MMVTLLLHLTLPQPISGEKVALAVEPKNDRTDNFPNQTKGLDNPQCLI